jgi:hypothetical protein
MLPNTTHGAGPANFEEILFNTPFGYMFPDLARSENCLLPEGTATQTALIQLGSAMGEPGTGAANDSQIPAIYTYLGQFIDHDITARTDRETEASSIGGPAGHAHPFSPLPPDQVVTSLKNGRRPQLDLDSLYGDGPGLLESPATPAATDADPIYDNNKKLLLQSFSAGIDLPRNGGKATIADGRNDENLNVSQLHAAFLACHNKVMDGLPGANKTVDYIKARQLVRWAYQCVVVSDYLAHVCDRNVVADVLADGPCFFVAGSGELFMPLEFSVAAFRFGHSMIRGSYKINNTTTDLSIHDILRVSDLLEPGGGDLRLKPQYIVDWGSYVKFGASDPANKARKIDPLLANGLFDLAAAGTAPGAMMRHLAQRNLLRGYLLSIPTGQCVAQAMGIQPLSEVELTGGQSNAINDALETGGFKDRSPLWYYLLREAEVQKAGESLGAVGSRLVAETIIGLLKHSPNSYLNCSAREITASGIELPGPGKPTTICTIGDLLRYAGVHPPKRVPRPKPGGGGAKRKKERAA